MCKPSGGRNTVCARCGGCGYIEYVIRECLDMIYSKLCGDCQ